MPAGGYWGRYLRVDLTTGEARFLPLPEEVRRRYIGGVGLGTWLLLREAPVGVDPLAPEAPLIFALSPLVGTPLTTSAKFAVVAKSPLTGRINDALSSSHFAIAAKRAGFDALVLVGACRRPSVLVIDGETLERGAAASAASEAGRPADASADAGWAHVTIEDGRDLWGLSAADAETRVRERLRARRAGGAAGAGREALFHIAAIGTAGENLVRFATLSNDGRHAGRGGLGAVMGSKRLKALAVRGTRFVPLADPKAVYTQAKDLSARSLGPATEKYRELGTVSNLVLFNRLAVLPTRNFQDSTFEAAAALSPDNLAAMRTKTRSSCAACTIGCEHVYGVRRDAGEPGASAPARTVRMEYESLFALGPLCGISDPDAVLEAAALCDELGIDTISAGGTIAFAMECATRGLIDPKRFPVTVPLEFGNAATVHTLLRLIARREGIGDLLAEGSRRAAAVIGGDAPDFAPHVKGLEIPGYEPRALQAMALGFAVGSRGADHNRSSAYEVDFSGAGDRMKGDADTARRAAATEDRAALMDALILCKFLRGVFTDLFEEAVPFLRAITGWDVTADELRLSARRIVVARKWFNEREGWTPAEDTLPRRFLSEPLRQGASAGASLSPARLASMIEAYNLHRGFTADGHVPEGLRRTIGIEG